MMIKNCNDYYMKIYKEAEAFYLKSSPSIHLFSFKGGTGKPLFRMEEPISSFLEN